MPIYGEYREGSPMPDNNPQERRKVVRFVIAIPLKYIKVSVKNLNSSYIHDISGQGLGLISSEQLPLNTQVVACLKIPDNGEEIPLEAEVIWSLPVAGSRYRSGLKLKQSDIKPVPLVLRTIYAKL